MSQQVGLNYKSRIPQFSDNASIEEALKVYHYGVDNYTTQPIPDDSIEGNFRSLNDRVASNETAISALGDTFIEQVSASASPNIITSETASTVPITVRGKDLQTGNLQQWQNSSSNNLAVVFSDGAASFNGYVNIGSNAKSSSTAANINIASPSHKGVVVKSALNQSANLQEWQDSSGSAVSWVDGEGRLYYRNDELSGGLNSFFLIGC